MKFMNRIFSCSLLFATFAALPAAAGALQNVATAPIQLADLRSFFHGDQAPPKAPPPKQLATLSTAPGIASDARVERFLRSLADALKAREGKPMLAQLSDKYTIEDLPPYRKPADLFLQAIEQIAGPSEMIITSLETRADVRIAKVEFHYGPEKGKVKMKTFQFDSESRLLSSDLFKLQVTQVGA